MATEGHIADCPILSAPMYSDLLALVYLLSLAGGFVLVFNLFPFGVNSHYSSDCS